MIAWGKFSINGAAPFMLSLFQDYGYVPGQNFPRLEGGPTFSSDIHVNKYLYNTFLNTSNSNEATVHAQ